MLTLTPSGLDTQAELSFFRELTGWDTGGAVRGAVVASLPLTDGAMNRRVSDAVVFVPEGLAVIRVVEVVRQSGVVTALPEGAWTIGPGAGPGDVLRLAGGGSTTLDGLMRAGMEAAVRLRKVGLEPGRIARLTVLSGDLHGLLPADGDLGEGDQVALLDPRSLLLGIARASRYAGTDNPRLWTTADVRAALEALGVGGRSPSVEELNGEGFPYSPYVLRRRELLAPATLASQPAVRTAAPTASPHTAGPTDHRPTDLPATGPGSSGAPVGSPDGPLVDPAAAAALAAAAVADQESRESAARAGVPLASALDPVPEQLRRTTRDTVALADREDAPPARETQQIRPVAPQRPASEESGGIGGLFPGGPPVSTPPRPTGAHGSESAPPWSPPVTPVEDPARGRRRGLLVVLAALALVVVLGVGGFLLTQGGDTGGGGDTDPAAQTTTVAPTTTAPPTPEGLPVGTTQQVGGTTFTLQAFAYDDSCADHSYGAAAGFFGTSDCAGLVRSLWSAQADGQAAVVSVSRVTMPDPSRAQALVALTDTAGTGNISDLLREGVRYAGGPEELSGAEYESAVTDDVATIVESSWTDPAAAGTPEDLDGLALDGLELDAQAS
ncbi:MAG: uncharacterized protein JWQ53_2968 [Klenkia sp.]|nr:uncharacterized protein [Klenkia sp.]